jgi:hypothetical protein
MTDEMMDAPERLIREGHDRDSVLRVLWRMGRAERFGLVKAPWEGGHFDRLCDQDYWGVVADLWTDAHSPNSQRRMWKALWGDPKRLPTRSMVMSESERAALSALPESVTGHRGHGPRRDRWRGLSWSLDFERARWFGHRSGMMYAGRAGLPPMGWVATVTIPKSLIAAVVDARQEREVVIPDLRRLKPTIEEAGDAPD